MTLLPITLSKLTLPAAALSVAVFGLTGTGMAFNQDETFAGPITCSFEVGKGAFGQSLKGIVTAQEDVSGSYQMNFTKRGANSASVKQSGAFRLKAGETATLGQASLGRSGNVSAELKLRINGEDLICRTDGTTDL